MRAKKTERKRKQVNKVFNNNIFALLIHVKEIEFLNYGDNDIYLQKVSSFFKYLKHMNVFTEFFL